MKTDPIPVHPGDADQALGSMTGILAARDVYRRYCQVARDHGREPAGTIAWGRFLTRRGVYRRVIKGRVHYSIY